MYHVSNSTHTVKLKSLWCTPEYLPHSSWNLFYFNPNHRFHLCVHYSMCRCVKITPRCVNKLISLPLSFVFFFFQKRWKWKQPARREETWGREGMRHWIRGWGSAPASFFWVTETLPRGSTNTTFLTLHQAFHMSQPRLSSSPGWRKRRKHMLYCFFSCSTSAWVGLVFLFVFVVKTLVLLLSG